MKRKGCSREAGSESSVEQRREPMDKNRIGGVSVGRAGKWPRSPYPSRTRSVDSAVVRWRRSNLPREICAVSRERDWKVRKGFDRGAEVSRGHSRSVASVHSIETLTRKGRNGRVRRTGNDRREGPNE